MQLAESCRGKLSRRERLKVVRRSPRIDGFGCGLLAGLEGVARAGRCKSWRRQAAQHTHKPNEFLSTGRLRGVVEAAGGQICPGKCCLLAQWS